MNTMVTGGISLHIYPLKSARASTSGDAVLAPTGLDHDRHWLLVNAAAAASSHSASSPGWH